MSEARLCVACPVYRATPREASWPQVCDLDRERLRTDLHEVPDLVVSTLARVELERAAGGPAVSGSKDPPAPVNLAALGVTQPPYTRGPRATRQLDFGRRPHGAEHEDQIGIGQPAATLDQWVTDWIDVRDLDESPPEPDLDAVVAWLAERLDWACDNHPAIDEFAADLKAMVRALRGIVGQDDPRGEAAGRCPAKLRDDTRCGTPLYADPYVDVIACTRCGRQWLRRDAGWVKLRAEQQRAEQERRDAGAGEAA